VKSLPIYQIDAFSQQPFAGNPAAVVPLQQWLPDEVMQNIATENNLAETVFFVPEGAGFYIRWFTPVREVKLCGHATLAAAYVLFEYLGYSEPEIRFQSLSGLLTVQQDNQRLTLNFPAQPPERQDCPEALVLGLGLQKSPTHCLSNEDWIAVFDSEDDILAIEPNHSELQKLDKRGVIATAPSDKYDFVARFFSPKYGIPEDPVTGSAYTQLMPYWVERLGKKALHAKQLSSRGGELWCEQVGDRVTIAGYATTYLIGEIYL
jgi:PhzF family phenazine biosynthesis protein